MAVLASPEAVSNSIRNARTRFMTRTLLLLRHAKSSWDDPSLPDRARLLNARGRRAVPLVAAYMRRNGLDADLVLCSTAARTVETLTLLQASLDRRFPHRLLRSLYLASPGHLLRIVRRAPEVGRMMVIAHNPGLQEFIIRLAGQPAGDPDEARRQGRVHAKFPTAALAVLRFDVDRWDDIEYGTGRLVDFTCPRDLA
jgi:phosphohistidine phosphatase